MMTELSYLGKLFLFPWYLLSKLLGELFLTIFSPESPLHSSLAVNTLSKVPIIGVEIEIPTTVIWLPTYIQ